MNRPLIIAAAFLAVCAWGFWQRAGWMRADATADALRTELATTTAALAQVEESARVHRAHLKRLDQLTSDSTATRNDLITMEGADAPLSPYLRAASGRLWPRTGE